MDIGTSIGKPAITASRRVGPAGQVVAIDQSPQMLAIAEERATAQGLRNLEFLVIDAEASDFSEGSFDSILCRIVKNSGKGSAILFDYYIQSVVDGSCELEMGKNILNQLVQLGEPLKLGINERAVDTFLEPRGFSKVHNVTSEDLKRAYFHGANESRAMCNLLSFAHATVE